MQIPIKKMCVCAGITLGMCSAAWAGPVTINTPEQWITLRSREIALGVQFDTSSIAGNEVVFRAQVMSPEAQMRTTVTKTVEPEGLSANITMPAFPMTQVGGREYIRLSWEVRGTEHTGSIVPLGLAVLDTVDPQRTTITAGSYTGDKASLVSDNDRIRQMDNGMQMCYAWNEDHFVIACKPAQAQEQSDTLVIAIDAKNGKNAFLSYADRFLFCAPEDASLQSVLFKRSFRTERVAYARENWHNDIQSERIDGWQVITIPWYDMGMVPAFDGRTIGFALFSKGESFQGIISEDASLYMPATWADCIFSEN